MAYRKNLSQKKKDMISEIDENISVFGLLNAFQQQIIFLIITCKWYVLQIDIFLAIYRDLSIINFKHFVSTKVLALVLHELEEEVCLQCIDVGGGTIEVTIFCGKTVTESL